MKRFRFLLVLTILLCAGVAVYASSTITVKASDLKAGETKTVVDDGKTITITRDGDGVKVIVEGDGEGRHHSRRIIINGTPLGDLLDHHVIRPRSSNQTWFVCPKDHAMLRVPEGNDADSFKCPVDGATMEKRKGRAFTFFFDEDFGDDL